MFGVHPGLLHHAAVGLHHAGALHHAIGERGRGIADVDLAAADVERAAVEGGLLGEPRDGVLGRRVGRRERARRVGRDRAVVDDAAAAWVCAFMMRKASWVQTNGPVRLVSTTARHLSSGKSSMGTAGAPMPALLKSRSSRPWAAFTAANSALMAAGSATSVGTTMLRPCVAAPSAATSSSLSLRRPASATT